jgi:hypothetical protein
LNVITPQQVQWKPPLPQAADTHVRRHSGKRRQKIQMNKKIGNKKYTNKINVLI